MYIFGSVKNLENYAIRYAILVGTYSHFINFIL